MIPLFEPVFDEDDVQAVSDVIRSGYVNDHVVTREFEEAFARKVGEKYAVATNNGTVALFMALRCLGIGLGDRVAVPDFTFIATANAVRLAGAEPVLVDVNQSDGTLDWLELDKEENIDAVIPVHINGAPCEMGDILRVATEMGWGVVEDASQALGNKNRLRGDVACYSFSPTKIITTGQGGMVTTDDEALYEGLSALKRQGRGGKPDYYPHEGYNFKFTDMQAALGLSQLKKLDERVAHMRLIAKAYAERLDGCDEPSYLPWRVELKTQRGLMLKSLLHKQGVCVDVPPMPLGFQPGFKPNFGGGAVAYRSSRLYLPSSPNLTERQVEVVCERINEVNAGE